jgi:GNAT superfamily N-acetyltransferase
MAAFYPASTLAGALPAMTTPRPELLASGHYFVAEVAGGRLVGVGGWSPGDPAVCGHADAPAAAEAHLRHFGTDPAWGGRGVGRSLAARCEAEATKAGVRVLLVYASLNAEGFYARCGFQRVRDEEVDISGASVKVVLMEKRARRRRA